MNAKYLLVLGLLTAGCSGGGSSGNGGGEYTGSAGTGAGGIPVFWWSYGGEDYGHGNAAAETTDGGFIVAGAKSSAGASFDPDTYDVHLVKTSGKGRVEWSEAFGAAGRWDSGNGVIQTTDGGYLAVGATMTAAGDQDGYLCKTFADGVLDWERTVGDASFDELAMAHEVPGGYVLVGDRTRTIGPGFQQDGATIGVDAAGNVLWEEFYGNDGFDRLFALEPTSDGGFILAGEHGGTSLVPKRDVWLVKTDALGNPEWELTYGPGRAWSVRQLANDGFALTGTTPAGAEDDCLVLATDQFGQETWRRTFGGADHDAGRGIGLTTAGDVVVAGGTQSFTSGFLPYQRQDVYLLKLDPTGATLWQKVKGLWPDNAEYGHSMLPTLDGGLLVAGSFRARMLLAKTDANGDTVKLGDRDVTIDVPNVQQKTINFYNALDVAGGTVSTVSILREITPFVAEMLIAALEGATPTEICDVSGAVSFVPVPVVPLVVGQSFLLTFAFCGVDSSDPVYFDGDFTVTIDLVTGTQTGYPYDLGTTVAIDLAVSDSEGLTDLSGDVTTLRSAASSSSYDDWIGVAPGSTIQLTAYGYPVLLSQLDLTAGRGGKTRYIGPASMVVTAGSIPTPLTATIAASERFEGSDPDAPGSGAMLVTAPDGSALLVTATGGGSVRLEVDADGDGTYDLTLNTSWDKLY